MTQQWAHPAIRPAMSASVDVAAVELVPPATDPLVEFARMLDPETRTSFERHVAFQQSLRVPSYFDSGIITPNPSPSIECGPARRPTQRDRRDARAESIREHLAALVKVARS